MNDTTLRVILLLVDILCPITLGYVLKQKNLVKPALNDFLIKFNVRVLFTVLAFVSFWRLKFTPEVALIPVVGALILFSPYFIGMFITKNVQHPLERGALVMSCMLGNTSTLGGLICFLLLGISSFAYVQVIGVMQSMVLLLFCFPVAQKFRDMAETKKGLAKKHSFKELFLTWNQISLLGMMAGAALSLGGVEQPRALEPVFTALVHIAAWVQLFPVGLLLNFSAARRQLSVNVLKIVPVKFLILPAFIWAVCALLFNDSTITATLVIQAMCPVGINTIFCCALYGLKTDTAMAAFMLTSILFLVFLCPVLFWVLL